MGRCILLILLPGSALGHNLQKPSKESGILQLLGTFKFVCFLLKRRVKRGAWPNAPHLLNTLLALSTHNRKCANKMHRIFFDFNCIFIFLLRESDQCAVRPRLGTQFGEALRIRVKILNKICLKIIQKALKWPFGARKFSKIFGGACPRI